MFSGWNIDWVVLLTSALIVGALLSLRRSPRFAYGLAVIGALLLAYGFFLRFKTFHH